MKTNDADFRSHIVTLAESLDFQKEIAQIQAKALLYDVTGQIPQYEWNYIARRVIRNIVIAKFELENIARETPEGIDELSHASRKFALVWEALANLRESTTKETALLNAAVNYELAGYQANAMCIAKQLLRDMAFTQEPSMITMCALFLERRFLRLLELSRKAQIEPSINDGVSVSLIAAMALALAGKAFAQTLRFFLMGDEQALESAIEIFKNSGNLFAWIG